MEQEILLSDSSEPAAVFYILWVGPVCMACTQMYVCVTESVKHKQGQHINSESCPNGWDSTLFE